MDSALNGKNIFIKHQDAVALLCFAATIVLLIWKAPFSYVNEDESYYYTIPLRLIMGDSLLSDEWNKAQLFSLLLYLPAKVYISLAGSTEGIILFFRYLFIAFQSTVSAFIYLRLRKNGICSILAALINLLHLPFTYMAMSYNTMGFAFVVLTGVLMSTTKKYNRAIFYSIGLLVACAVLCNPVFAVVYLFYSISMVIYEINKNNKQRLFKFTTLLFSFKTWQWITFGILTVLAIFLLFLFSRTNIKEIIQNFPMLFTDPKLQKKITIQKSLFVLIKIYPYLFFAYGIIMTAVALDKKRIIHRTLYLTAVSVVYFAFMTQIILAPALPDRKYFFWMLPLSLLGLTCYSLLKNKDKSIFVFLWFLGILYALCISVSSNTAPWSSSFALGVSDIASVIFINDLFNELIQNKTKFKHNYNHNNNAKFNKKNEHNERLKPKAIALILISALFFQIGAELYINADLTRYSVEHAFAAYSHSTAKLNTTIEAGPLKGIKTTAETVKLYDNILKDLSVIKHDKYGPVLVTPFCPFCYLYLNMPYAAYSSEIYYYINNNRLTKYYELHPEKEPKYIYISKTRDLNFDNEPEKTADVLANISSKYNCTIQESNVGYIVKINDLLI